jgi:hypothetical protein
MREPLAFSENITAILHRSPGLRTIAKATGAFRAANENSGIFQENKRVVNVRKTDNIYSAQWFLQILGDLRAAASRRGAVGPAEIGDFLLWKPAPEPCDCSHSTVFHADGNLRMTLSPENLRRVFLGPFVQAI